MWYIRAIVPVAVLVEMGISIEDVEEFGNEFVFDRGDGEEECFSTLGQDIWISTDKRNALHKLSLLTEDPLFQWATVEYDEQLSEELESEELEN